MNLLVFLVSCIIAWVQTAIVLAPIFLFLFVCAEGMFRILDHYGIVDREVK